jgi:hypothetical protein
MEIFKNIAPVSPTKALEAMERAANGDNGNQFTSRENTHYYEFVRLLRHLAYDPELFKRSVNILSRYALSEKPEENRNSTRDIFKSLFYIHLSGTRALAETRAKVIEELVDSADQDKQELGLILLDAALETWHFSSHYDFEFGARPRDYGWYPRTHEDVVHWYKIFIDICTRLALSRQPIAEKARKILSDSLRGLWTNGGMFEVLENSIKQIHKQQAWNDVWVAVRGIIRHDGKGFKEDILKKLYELEKFLEPNDLYELARTYALSEQRLTFDLEDAIEDNEDVSSAWKRVEDKTRNIGARVAQDIDTLNTLLPELVSTNNTRLFFFGRGLADGCEDKKNLWQILRNQLEKTPYEKRQVDVFIGFLSSCAEKDPAFYGSALDSLIDDELLSEWFPIFQTTSIIDRRGVERLHKALDTGKVKVHTFQYLARGGVHESINDDNLADLLKKILSKENGIETVIEILKMRSYIQREELTKYSSSLSSIARNVLSMYEFPKERGRHNNLDYGLAQIARVCLDGSEGINAATEICRHLAEASSDYRIYAFDYPHLLSSLACAQPSVFLDVFLVSEGIKDYQYNGIFSQDSKPHSPNPLNQISDEDLISWCDNDSNRRYPLIASTIQTFSQSKETEKIIWKPIVYSIFEKAPDLSIVLEHLARSIWPMGYSGLLSDILQERLVLFQDLFEHDNAEVRAWAKARYSALQETIEREREREKAQDRDRNESFE